MRDATKKVTTSNGVVTLSVNIDGDFTISKTQADRSYHQTFPYVKIDGLQQSDIKVLVEAFAAYDENEEATPAMRSIMQVAPIFVNDSTNPNGK